MKEVSIYPGPIGDVDATGGYALLNYALGCGRDGLHLCQINRPDQLIELWPWMKEQIEKLRTKNPPRQHWLPEHVRIQILQGIANQNAVECFVAHNIGSAREPESLHGMIIVHPLIDPFVNLPLTWFVWLGIIEPKVLERLLPEFEQLARARGYLHWKWTTSRKGWARRAAKFGAKVVEYALEKEL